MTAIGAISKQRPQEAPGEVDGLLPWLASGTLNARDTRRVDEAMARNPELARQYAAIREERTETILLNEDLGVPSVRAMQKLFAAIDAEPSREAYASFNISARIADGFARLSPRTLATAATVAVAALLVQAGVIGAVLMKPDIGTVDATSPAGAARLGADSRPYALVRFAPDAKVSDITAFLDSYQAAIVDGARGGMFRLQFGDRAMSKDEVAALMGRLQDEKIISLAVAAQ